jgi:hypothetical protein
MQETRHTATFVYPGALVSEPGRTVRIPEPTAAAVMAAGPDEGWYGAEVKTSVVTRYRSDEGDERWLHTGSLATFNVYVGEEFTAEQVEQLPGDHRTLLANMRGNGWDRVVRTRRGNWQPVESGDVVIQPALV